MLELIGLSCIFHIIRFEHFGQNLVRRVDRERLMVVVGLLLLVIYYYLQKLVLSRLIQKVKATKKRHCSHKRFLNVNLNQLLEPSSSTASNKNLLVENSLEYDRDRILQLIQNPTAFPIFVEFDFRCSVREISFCNMRILSSTSAHCLFSNFSSSKKTEGISCSKDDEICFFNLLAMRKHSELQFSSTIQLHF